MRQGRVLEISLSVSVDMAKWCMTKKIDTAPRAIPAAEIVHGRATASGTRRATISQAELIWSQSRAATARLTRSSVGLELSCMANPIAPKLDSAKVYCQIKGDPASLFVQGLRCHLGLP